MTGAPRELAFRLHLHRRLFLLTAEVKVSDSLSLNMIVDTGSLGNSVSSDRFDVLEASGHIAPTSRSLVGNPLFVIGGATIAGQPIPALEVYVSDRVTELDLDGILGLAFLGQFRHVALDVPTLQLALRY